MNKIDTRFVINNGLKEMAANAVELVVDDKTGIAYAVYSSGELHPTEGLMDGWSQGKDCLNYIILHEQDPILTFEKR